MTNHRAKGGRTAALWLLAALLTEAELIVWLLQRSLTP